MTGGGGAAAACWTTPDLLGNHIEVIDEFPSFSYILGDNHPHVLAMPIVMLVIAVALAISSARPAAGSDARWLGRLRSAMPLGIGGISSSPSCRLAALDRHVGFAGLWLLIVTALAR